MRTWKSSSIRNPEIRTMWVLYLPSFYAKRSQNFSSYCKRLYHLLFLPNGFCLWLILCSLYVNVMHEVHFGGKVLVTCFLFVLIRLLFCHFGLIFQFYDGNYNHLPLRITSSLKNQLYVSTTMVFVRIVEHLERLEYFKYIWIKRRMNSS